MFISYREGRQKSRGAVNMENKRKRVRKKVLTTMVRGAKLWAG